ncbi:hypothetical protein CsSME_00051088 [Camellia sinensis var. sinensis]
MASQEHLDKMQLLPCVLVRSGIACGLTITTANLSIYSMITQRK